MREKICWSMLVALAAVFLLAETSEAQLFRRGRRYNNYNYSGGGNMVSSTPLANLAKPLMGFLHNRTRRNRSEYDYNWAARRDWHRDQAEPVLFADKVRVNVMLKPTTASSQEKLLVRASWVYLHKSRTWHTDWMPVERVGDKAYYDLAGLEEGRVVKIISDIYIATDKEPSESALKNASYVKTETGNYKYVGRMHVPYYGVTSSENNEELKRRAQIVSFGFSQWYADEAYGGRRCSYDCYSFFRSCTSGELSGFELKPVSRQHIPTLSKRGKRIHGDFLTKPGHYGMALCYDEDTKNLITLEGNYALNGPYRINIDPYRHGLNTWSSIQTISAKKPKPAPQPEKKDMGV
ncbi:MAG: hypothetical protein RIC55_14050 [Pirellulaceae bacterium]